MKSFKIIYLCFFLTIVATGCGLENYSRFNHFSSKNKKDFKINDSLYIGNFVVAHTEHQFKNGYKIQTLEMNYDSILYIIRSSLENFNIPIVFVSNQNILTDYKFYYKCYELFHMGARLSKLEKIKHDFKIDENYKYTLIPILRYHCGYIDSGGLSTNYPYRKFCIAYLSILIFTNNDDRDIVYFQSYYHSKSEILFDVYDSDIIKNHEIIRKQKEWNILVSKVMKRYIKNLN